jgi:branched-chain amino acid transport system substrate-binding protein
MRKIVFVLVTALCVFLTLSYNVSAEVRGVTDKSIKIGVSIDMTGPAAGTCVLATEAMRTYTRYINDSGGVNGRQLNLIIEDDRYSIPPAIAALKKLVYRDKIFALIGPSSISQTNALWKSVQKEKLPTMSISLPEVAVSPFKRYLFVITDIAPGQAKVLIDYMIKDFNLKEPKVALVYPDTEAGKTDLAVAIERLKKYNITPVTKEVLAPGSIDAGSQVMNIKRYKANVIAHVGTIPSTTITLLRDSKKMGLKIPIFGSFAAMLGEEINAIGEAANQFYSVHAMSPWYGKGPGVEEMRKITLKYHPGTEKPYRGTFYTHGWILKTVMVEGLKRAGRNLDGEALVDALESIKDYNAGGLCAPITYSSESHKGGDSWKIYRADPAGGKYVPMTEWRKSE